MDYEVRWISFIMLFAGLFIVAVAGLVVVHYFISSGQVQCSTSFVQSYLSSEQNTFEEELSFIISTEQLCVGDTSIQNSVVQEVHSFLMSEAKRIIDEYSLENKTAEAFQFNQFSKELAENQMLILDLPVAQASPLLKESHGLSTLINKRLFNITQDYADSTGEDFAVVKSFFDSHALEIGAKNAKQDVCSRLISILENSVLEEVSQGALSKARSAFEVGNYDNSITFALRAFGE